MRGVGIDWTGQAARLARSTRRSIRYEETSSGTPGDPLFSRGVTTAIWVGLAIFVLCLGHLIVAGGILGGLGVRSAYYAEQE